jgi:hypothetical protein
MPRRYVAACGPSESAWQQKFQAGSSGLRVTGKRTFPCTEGQFFLEKVKKALET